MSYLRKRGKSECVYTFYIIYISLLLLLSLINKSIWNSDLALFPLITKLGFGYMVEISNKVRHETDETVRVLDKYKPRLIQIIEEDREKTKEEVEQESRSSIWPFPVPEF